jgi:hypothetical protein
LRGIQKISFTQYKGIICGTLGGVIKCPNDGSHLYLPRRDK